MLLKLKVLGALDEAREQDFISTPPSAQPEAIDLSKSWAANSSNPWFITLFCSSWVFFSAVLVCIMSEHIFCHLPSGSVDHFLYYHIMHQLPGELRSPVLAVFKDGYCNQWDLGKVHTSRRKLSNVLSTQTVQLGNRLGLLSQPCGNKFSKEGHHTEQARMRMLSYPSCYRLFGIACPQ